MAYGQGVFVMSSRERRNALAEARREATRAAIYARGDMLAVGTIVFTVLIFAGSYLVCAPGVIDPTMCTAVTKVGLNSFMAHAIEFTSVVGLTIERIWRRTHDDRASIIAIDVSSDDA